MFVSLFLDVDGLHYTLPHLPPSPRLVEDLEGWGLVHLSHPELAITALVPVTFVSFCGNATHSLRLAQPPLPSRDCKPFTLAHGFSGYMRGYCRAIAQSIELY